MVQSPPTTAKLEALSNGMPDVVNRAFDRLFDLQAAAQMHCNRRRQRAPGAVDTVDIEPLTAEDPNPARSAQQVHDILRLPMATGDNNAPGMFAQRHSCLSLLGLGLHRVPRQFGL